MQRFKRHMLDVYGDVPFSQSPVDVSPYHLKFRHTRPLSDKAYHRSILFGHMEDIHWRVWVKRRPSRSDKLYALKKIHHMRWSNNALRSL